MQAAKHILLMRVPALEVKGHRHDLHSIVKYTRKQTATGNKMALCCTAEPTIRLNLVAWLLW